ncbi:MAG: type II toxin-antitoxin system VapC family toxin [Deltaproteobacteria bacterium]|nr:type II toxin-antitoxin system VapC family toxin [Deltaproteobacteria bacterium]
MTFVLDASVAVAAVRPGEPHHVRSRRLLERVILGPATIVVPSIFAVEVAAALVRIGEPADAIVPLLAALGAPPHEVVSIGRARARRAAEIAMRCRLRAADAIYVWLAAERQLPLLTLDEEVRLRAAGHCEVRQP